MNEKSAATRPMSAVVWAQLLLLGAIWGGSFFFARIAVEEIAPFTLVLLRALSGRGIDLDPAVELEPFVRE